MSSSANAKYKYKVVQDRFFYLAQNFLEQDLSKIAAKLFEMGLIGSSCLNKAKNTTLMAYDRSTGLLREVLWKIEEDHSNYDRFLSVMREFAHWAEIAKELEEALKSEQTPSDLWQTIEFLEEEQANSAEKMEQKDREIEDLQQRCEEKDRRFEDLLKEKAEMEKKMRELRERCLEAERRQTASQEEIKLLRESYKARIGELQLEEVESRERIAKEELAEARDLLSKVKLQKDKEIWKLREEKAKQRLEILEGEKKLEGMKLALQLAEERKRHAEERTLKEREMVLAVEHSKEIALKNKELLLKDKELAEMKMKHTKEELNRIQEEARKKKEEEEAHSNKLAKKPSPKEALEALFSVADKWKLIGTFLDVPKETLNSIQREVSGQERLLEVVNAWLTSLDSTWGVLIKAVRKVDENRAAEIERELDSLEL